MSTDKEYNQKLMANGKLTLITVCNNNQFKINVEILFMPYNI